MPRPSTSFDPTNLLLGLAWLGELDRQQIQRLWFTNKSASTVEKTLAGLRRQKLITVRAWSIRDEQRQITVPQAGRWSLTTAGHLLIKVSDQCPVRPAQNRRQGLIPHDARTTEVIVRLIELARSRGLSGIFVARELRLNPQQRRPVCDALVVMQLGSFDRPDLVPWSNDPAIANEERVRFAIEADNATEPLAVIQAKAATYRKLAENRSWTEWWQQQFGPLPIPLWVAPTDERAFAIHAQWKQAWPLGEWLVTSDEGLADNRLLRRSAGSECSAHIFCGGGVTTAAASHPKQLPPSSLLAQPRAGEVLPAAPLPPTVVPEIVLTTRQPAVPSPLVAQPTARSTALPADEYAAIARHASLQNPQATFRRGGLRSAVHRLGMVMVALLLMAPAKIGRVIEWYINLDGYHRQTVHTRLLILIIGVLAVIVAARLSIGWPTWSSEISNLIERQRASATETAPTTPVFSLSPTAPLAPVCLPVRVQAERLNLRAEPGLKGQVLRKLQLDELLTIIDCTGIDLDGFTWWQVHTEDGQLGWAAANWLDWAE